MKNLEIGMLVEIKESELKGLRLRISESKYMPNGSMQCGSHPHTLYGLGIYGIKTEKVLYWMAEDSLDVVS
jgi:hypothetical protein